MSSGPSLIFSNNAYYQPTMKFLMNISVGSFITISNFAIKTGIDYSESIKVLEKLSQGGFLEKMLAIRCIECGLLLETVKPEDYVANSQYYCANCDANLEITNNCVDVIFKVIKNPFATGRENKTAIAMHSSAPTTFSIETYLNNGGSFNRELFSPSDEDYNILTKQYDNIFKPHKTTKERGDSLEDLVFNLFNCCKHFLAAKNIRLGNNQIDCFVRNKMFIPGISKFGTCDFFVIECKNEDKTPGSTYFNKLHSILINNSLQFGIIISKKRAASTLKEVARTLFLKNKIIMINLDSNDLKEIIIGRKNLLECLERKIAEIKLCVNEDLIKIGLFEA